MNEIGAFSTQNFTYLLKSISNPLIVFGQIVLIIRIEIEEYRWNVPDKQIVCLLCSKGNSSCIFILTTFVLIFVSFIIRSLLSCQELNPRPKMTFIPMKHFSFEILFSYIIWPLLSRHHTALCISLEVWRASRV